MKLHRVEYPGHPYLPFLQTLYESAFPLRERRLWQQMLKLLSHPRMTLSVIEDQDRPVGLIVWWQLTGWYYVEHLAIDPSHRGKAYGSKVIRYLVALSENRLILEVELCRNNDEQSCKRIAFYKRNGLQVVPFPYQQPPYRIVETPLPMQLMSIPVIHSRELFEMVTDMINREVYLPFYNEGLCNCKPVE